MKDFGYQRLTTRQPQWHHGVRQTLPDHTRPGRPLGARKYLCNQSISFPGLEVEIRGAECCRFVCAGFHDVCLSGILVHLVLRDEHVWQDWKLYRFPNCSEEVAHKHPAHGVGQRLLRVSGVCSLLPSSSRTSLMDPYASLLGFTYCFRSSCNGMVIQRPSFTAPPRFWHATGWDCYHSAQTRSEWPRGKVRSVNLYSGWAWAKFPFIFLRWPSLGVFCVLNRCTFNLGRLGYTTTLHWLSGFCATGWHDRRRVPLQLRGDKVCGPYAWLGCQCFLGKMQEQRHKCVIVMSLMRTF